MSDTVLSREPWPRDPIEQYPDEHHGTWGYLVHYKRQGLVFETDKTPQPDEIRKRWSAYFRHD